MDQVCLRCAELYYRNKVRRVGPHNAIPVTEVGNCGCCGSKAELTPVSRLDKTEKNDVRERNGERRFGI